MLKLHDLVAPADLRAAREAKLINVRESGDGQRIFNYTDAAMWTPGAWESAAVRQCRGLIVDADDVVIARPWAKFFNHGQAEAGSLDLHAPVEVTDKLDGSLGVLHYDADGRPRVATRGSFLSEQALHATEVLRRDGEEPTLGWPDGFTPLVEIIYPSNRIVCDYGDRDELVLLGGVWIDSGEYVGPDEAADLTDWEGRTADTFEFPTLADALAAPPRAGAEGLAVRYLSEPRIVKIKQADYVALHRIVTGLSERTIWEAICEGNAVTDVLEGLPDELHDWVREVWVSITTTADEIHAEAHEVHESIIRELDPDFERRDYAEQAKSCNKVRPYLFNILDAKDPRPGILKTLRPVGDTRAISRTEDVA